MSKVFYQTQGSRQVVPHPRTCNIKRPVTQPSPGPWYDTRTTVLTLV